MKVSILCAFLLSTLVSYSQTTFLKITVNPALDHDGLSKAILFRNADSSLVKGHYLDTAYLEMQFQAEMGEALYLKLVTPEYLDTIIHFTKTGEYIDLGVVHQVKNQSLDAVEVSYKKPMFERTMNGISVNVDGTTLAQLNTLFDVLNASPRLTSPDDESIEIIGKGSPLILVDRQPIITNEELKAIPANQVERVEIITNPSAKYKAQGSGGGVIEVYTKNFSLEGYQSTIRVIGGVTSQVKPTEAINLGLNFKKKKFSLNSYVGINHRTNNYFSESAGQSTIGLDRSFEGGSSGDNSNIWQYYNLKAAYSFSESKRLTAGVNGYGSFNWSDNSIQTRYFNSDTLVTLKQAQSKNASRWLNNSAFVNYTWETDTLGSSFEVNANVFRKVSSATRENLSSLENVILNEETRFDAKLESRDQPIIGEIRMNYEHYFDTSGWILNVGGEYSKLINGQRFRQFDLINERWEENSLYTNSYDYEEDNAGLFAEVSKQWDKIGVRLGLRGEYTKLYGYSQTLGQTFMDSNYIALFPSGGILYEPNDNVAFTLYYDSGIDRPSFANYDPFVRYVDSMSIEYGNPFLRPAFDHSLGLEVDLFYAYNISLNYYRLNAPVSELNFIQPNSFLSESTPYNALYEESVELSLSCPIETEWLSGWNSFWVSKNYYAFQEVFNREQFSNLTYGFYSYLNFKLPRKWSVQNRLNISRWGGDNVISRMNYSWAVRVTKKFDKNAFQCFMEVANIAPRQNENQFYNGNYVTNSSGQYQFTSFKMGMFIKLGRLKAPDMIQDSKSGQSGRM